MDEFEYEANGAMAFCSELWSKAESKSIRTVSPWYGDPEVKVPVRIGICGAHSTGKTTLANELSKTIKIPLIHEVARTVFSLGFPRNKDTTMQTQLAIWLAQLYEQQEMEEFISDRTYIDILVYATWLEEHDLLTQQEKYLLNAIKNLSYHLCQDDYTAVFYLPICWEPKDDGIRDIDPQYQKEIDQLMLQYLDAFDMDYFPLPGQEKLPSALSYLGDLGLLEAPEPPLG